MNVQGNTYTIVYASVLVIIVAAILSFAAITFEPYQEANIRIEKMQNILSSVHINSTVENAEKLFEKYITDSYVVSGKGNKIEGKAFNINLKKELSLPPDRQKLPVFICTKDGNNKTIIPMSGKGLWGAIWGYISFKEDLNTIFGTNFAHAKETPGLGAEISEKWFQKKFEGKKIFDNSGRFVSVLVIKGGAQPGNIHGVDAISGGTITSKGLEKMLSDCLKLYENYFKMKKK